MALPSSGSISLSQVNTELGYSSTAQISMGDSAVRTLFGVSSGVIAMSNGYGKANQFAFTISSNQTNANLRTLAINAGWNQSSKVVATISSGVYVSSNSTGTPALTVSGSFPGGVELVNNGYIIGMGGNGGSGSMYGCANASSGSSGGLALSVSTSISITNNNTIGGGGGGGVGGGGRWASNDCCSFSAGGGGGGGGRSGAASNSSGGARGYCTFGDIKSYGSDGGSGTVSSAGSGGGGGYIADQPLAGGAGGSGGSWGSSGGSGGTGYGGNISLPAGGGGGGGSAVSGNGYISWVATGARYGSIS